METTMENFDWLYKARSPYWEEQSPGKRYGIIRLIKNRSEEFAGQYTQEAVELRINTKKGILRNFETGATPEVYEALVPALIADLGMTPEMFYTQEKIRATPAKRGPATPTAPAVAAPTVELKIPATQSAPAPATSPTVPDGVMQTRKKLSEIAESYSGEIKSSTPQTCITKIVNHTVDTVVIVIKGDELHIMYDCAASLKVLNSIWVAPADDLGSGTKLIPRCTPIVK